MCGLVNFMFKTLLMDHLQSFIIVSMYVSPPSASLMDMLAILSLSLLSLMSYMKRRLRSNSGKTFGHFSSYSVKSRPLFCDSQQHKELYNLNNINLDLF